MSEAIRAAAQREAERLSEHHPVSPCDDLERAAFVAGATWAASRLPSRDEIADRAAWFFGPEDTPEQAADAVLKLIEERIGKSE